MKLLLDSHALLWFIGGDSNLSATARSLIEDTSHKTYVSIASIWETAIKVSIGKMTLTAPFDQLFPNHLDINGFELLPISVANTSRVATLPFHHRDPFDRLIAAQALDEECSLISIDSVFDAYGVDRLW